MTYTWTDNAMQSGTACNVDTVNTNLMHLKYDAGLPVGSIILCSMSTAPTGFLKANGAAISRTTYANLFAVLVTNAGFTSQNFTVTIASPAVFTKSGHGFTGGERLRLSTTGTLPTGLNTTTDYFVKKIDTNTFNLCSDAALTTVVNTSETQSGTHSYLQSLFGLGDGSTTFNLPDLRGEFIRSWDDSRGIDSSRSFGSWQTQDVQPLTYEKGVIIWNTAGTNVHGDELYTYQYAGTNVSGATGIETRPRNIALLACIKY